MVNRGAEATTAARALLGRAHRPGQIEENAVVSRDGQVHPAAGFLSLTGVPEDIDVALTIHRHRWSRLNALLVVHGERLLLLEHAGMVGTGIKEPVGILVEPGGMQQAVRTDGQLASVDGTQAMH